MDGNLCGAQERVKKRWVVGVERSRLYGGIIGGVT